MRINLLTSLLVFIFLSCKEQDKLKEINNLNTSEKLKTHITFYDTVFQHKKTYGKVIYNMDLDSLDPSMIRKRYVFFVASVNNKELKTFDEIGRNPDYMEVDSTGNGVFLFHVKFPKLGKSFLNLAFEESIQLKKGDKAIRLNTVKSRFITVLDSSHVVGNKGDTIYFNAEKEVRIKRKDSAKLVNDSRRKSDSMKKILNN